MRKTSNMSFQLVIALILSVGGLVFGMAGLASDQVSVKFDQKPSESSEPIEVLDEVKPVDASEPSVSGVELVSVQPVEAPQVEQLNVETPEPPAQVVNSATATLFITSQDQRWHFSGNVAADSTVEDFMRSLEAQGLNVHWDDFPGMGAFVQGLMGVESQDGKYWIYYVNGEAASKGVSEQIIKAEDSIEWRYE